MNERSPFRLLFWVSAAATAAVAGYIALAGGPEAVEPFWAVVTLYAAVGAVIAGAAAVRWSKPGSAA